jgi:hypothetical protein
MTVILWAVLALVAGLAALALGARRIALRRPPLELAPGESFPPTQLERLARQTLGWGLVPVILAGAIVIWAGAERFYQDDTIRVAVTLLLMAALLVLAGFGFRASHWARQRTGPLDERDRAILEQAPAIEGGPMIVTLALWVVGLQQTFWSAGAVPLVYLYLVFWSVLMVKALALPVGVLIGYRRS